MDQNKNGIKGESIDYYLATRFPTGGFGTYDTSLTTSSGKPKAKRPLPFTAIDAYFQTY
ncbi:MAG: hypothetical protein L0228_21785 [Planctomycetes bacterium]|nr:hypothetical protein [Planctomycetota bacterium]